MVHKSLLVIKLKLEHKLLVVNVQCSNELPMLPAVWLKTHIFLPFQLLHIYTIHLDLAPIERPPDHHNFPYFSSLVASADEFFHAFLKRLYVVQKPRRTRICTAARSNELSREPPSSRSWRSNRDKMSRQRVYSYCEFLNGT